jgi:hypothetical protein
VPNQTLIVSVALHVTACGSSPSSWFVQGGCGSDNVRKSLISFWEGFAADLTTDLMSKLHFARNKHDTMLTLFIVMLLPIGIMKNLQMPILRKIQICALFALGILVVIASVVRVIQVGATTGASNTTPALTWLALWSVIESSVAIMVGCGPGLYRKAKTVYSSTPTYAYNSRGYLKTSDSRRTGIKNHTDELYGLPMELMKTEIAGRSSANGGSKEELIEQGMSGGITVTKSVRVSH